MNKKVLSIFFATGLIVTSVVSASASSFTKKGVCNSVPCSAILTLGQGNVFSAGTYADKTMQTISVVLDGDNEWWADTDSRTNSTIAFMKTTIDSGHAYSTHHADNGRGDDFDRSINYEAGNYN